jgi:Tfp pilus tip-associated adhesin PilY1
VADGRRRILYGRPATALRPELSLGTFDTSAGSLADLAGLMIHDNWESALPGAANKATATRNLVEWITGIEKSGWRNRTVGDPWSDNATPGVWRLGDVINSKPILVSAPQSNFDILYGDRSYTQYRIEESGRRQMVYFGANDGMLHAVNVGFYGWLRNGQVEFSQDDPGGSRKAHERGAEIWAYIPTSLLPHLLWLPDPEYNHAYYVDLKPLVNDIKIGNEWHTVLLGGLRLGGRPITTPDAATAGAEHYYSEIFALDITDPEHDPKLLWRFSTRELGLTVGLPSIISHDGDWYAVIPSGPVTDKPVAGTASAKAHVLPGADSPYEAYSDQKARLFVLDAATGVPVAANSEPGYLTVSEDRSFFNNPFLPAAQARTTPWTNHALYYGLTVSHDHASCLDSGAVYRLQTVYASTGKPMPVGSWQIRRLFNTDAPVTGAVNSTYDSAKNLWVLFGTGRLWSLDDIVPCSTVNSAACKTNHRHHIYGIKEELDEETRNMTFSDRTEQAKDLMDLSGAAVYTSGAVTGLGASANIGGSSSGTTDYAKVQLASRSAKTIGYKRALDLGKLAYPTLDSYEMVITQPKLVPTGNGESLMAFTSFAPREAGCGDFGDGYLYLIDTFTGLPNPSTMSLFTNQAADPQSSNPLGRRVAGGLTTGKGTPTEAFVIASSAGITVSASAPDASTTSIYIPSGALQQSDLTSWREVLDYGFSIPPDVMSSGLGADTPARPSR